MDFKMIGNKIVKGLKWFFHSYIWLFVLLFVIDLVTKLVIVNHFAHTDNAPIVLLGTEDKPFLRIVYAINDKAAFGFGIPNQPLANRITYCIVAILGSAVIIGIYVWKFKKLNAMFRACLMLMAVGALGNLVDRLFYTPSFLDNEVNGVVDWIDFAGIWQFVFNIADSCVVIGTIMLAIYLIADEVKTTKTNRAKEVKETGGKVLSKEEQERLAKSEEKEASKEEKSEETESAESEAK